MIATKQRDISANGSLAYGHEFRPVLDAVR